MGNTYPPLSKRNKDLNSSRVGDEEDWGTDLDGDVVSLLEENARLRALVVQLSDLVLKNVVDQK